MMNIVHIIGFFDQEAWFRENYYTQYLSQNNNVSIITSNISFPYARRKKKRYCVKETLFGKVKVYRQKCIHIKDFVYFKYKGILDDLKPDVVHIYEFRQFISYLVAGYCIDNKIKFVYEHEQRGPGLTRMGRIKSHFLIEILLRNRLKYAALIRTVTPGASEYIQGITKNRNIFVSTLGFDERRSFFEKNARSKFIDPKDGIIIGMTGKLQRNKKVEVIMNAFSKILSNNIKLVIVGSIESDYFNELKAKESDRISIFNHFMNKTELNNFYSLCDYVFFSSASISYFEALGTGATIIVPRGSATKHLVSKNIIFYGNENNVSYMDNLIINDNEIEYELILLLSKLKKPKRFIDNKYNVKLITEQLEQQYLNIHSRPIYFR